MIRSENKSVEQCVVTALKLNDISNFSSDQEMKLIPIPYFDKHFYIYKIFEVLF